MTEFTWQQCLPLSASLQSYNLKYYSWMYQLCSPPLLLLLPRPTLIFLRFSSRRSRSGGAGLGQHHPWQCDHHHPACLPLPGTSRKWRSVCTAAQSASRCESKTGLQTLILIWGTEYIFVHKIHLFCSKIVLKKTIISTDFICFE